VLVEERPEVSDIDPARPLWDRPATVRIKLVLGVAVLAAGVFASTGGTVASAECSRAAALEVGKPFFWDAKTTVAQVLCGEFAGPGSDAMAIAFAAPTCWSPQGWAVFRFTDGGWRLVLQKVRGFIFPLVAVGRTIRETAPVFRPGDPRCLPSGGKHTRDWKWDGRRLVAGPWRQTQPPAGPTAPTNPTRGWFETPSGNIQCLGIGNLVQCGIRSGFKPTTRRRPDCTPYDRIGLRASGRPDLGGSICPGEDEGDAGPYTEPGVSWKLGYGRTWTGRGVRCTSAMAGLTCRNSAGHGFFLSRERWRQF
jgi:hypothetical protein